MSDVTVHRVPTWAIWAGYLAGCFYLWQSIDAARAMVSDGIVGPLSTGVLIMLLVTSAYGFFIARGPRSVFGRIGFAITNTGALATLSAMGALVTSLLGIYAIGASQLNPYWSAAMVPIFPIHLYALFLSAQVPNKAIA